jgi:hypothetical protein
MKLIQPAMILITMTALVPACFFGQLKKQQEQCDRDVSSMLSVPSEPPVADLSGRWACVYDGPEGSNNEALDIVQNGGRATVTMRDGYNDSAVSDGQVGGNVLAWKYEGGSAVRFELDPSGRMLDGQVRSGAGGDCDPRRYTCTRR